MMALKQIFRDELAYLKLQGKEFSRRNPGLSRFLSDESTDPDIERLLEGFAFLSARLRHKIEDDFPELTHSLLNLLWPNYLRPVPSTTIVQFSPVEHAVTNKQVIPRGVDLQSRPIEGTRCHFRTCHDVPVYPLQLNGVDTLTSRENAIIGLDFNTLAGIPFGNIGCDELPIFISEDEYTAQTLYLWIFQYLTEIQIKIENDTIRSLPASSVRPCGFAAQDALLPYPENAFDGYRVLQEYLAMPARFCFFSLTGLATIWPLSNREKIRIELLFHRPLPKDIKIRFSSFSLYCTPAVNLFSHDADPISLTGKSTEYRVHPSGNKTGHYEIFSIDKVTGWTGKPDQHKNISRSYRPFESFDHETTLHRDEPSFRFQTRIRSSISDHGFDHFVRFMRNDETHFCPGDTESISIDLSCSNRNLPTALAVGDLCIPSEEVPSFVSFRNITRPTEALRPLLNDSLHWLLVSNMSMNYRTLLDPDPMRNLIRSYDFRAMVDQQATRRSQARLAGINKITSKPVDRLLDGMPVRGLQSTLYLNPAGYLCEGELFLFGVVLTQFFSLFSSINSFHQLSIVNIKNQEIYSWQPQTGNQPLI